MKIENEVPLKKGYRYRIYPNKQQEEQLGQLFGCSRYVYNKLLEENNKAYELYKTTKDTRKWACLHCGTLHQRDHNSALNLLHLAENEHKIYKDHEKSVFVLEPFR